MPPSRPWPYRREFVVEYHHLDVLGHLNHAAYFPWMETLRCEYYLGASGSLDPSKLDIIIAEADCRYLRPAGYGTVLLGEVAPAAPLGTTSFSLLYRFSDPNLPSTVYARGRTVVVSYEYAQGRKKPIPPALRSKMEADGTDPTDEGWA